MTVRWHATGIGALTEAAWLDGQPAYQGQPIDMLWLQPGEHTLRVRVTDDTGRTAEAAITFTVAVSLEGLLEATGRLVTEGAIAPPPGRRLEACLKAARANARRGSRMRFSGRLRVFLDELDAHVGQGLSPRAHTLLRRDALSLLDFQG